LGDDLQVSPFEMLVRLEDIRREDESFILFTILVLDDIDIGVIDGFYYVTFGEGDGGGVCGSIDDCIRYSSVFGLKLEVEFYGVDVFVQYSL